MGDFLVKYFGLGALLGATFLAAVPGFAGEPARQQVADAGSLETITVTAEGTNPGEIGVARDVAGNVGAATSAALQIDKTPPTIVASRSPEAIWPPASS